MAGYSAAQDEIRVGKEVDGGIRPVGGLLAGLLQAPSYNI